MDAKKIRETRQRLTTKYEELMKSINRNRLATEQIKLEKTEDEGDLAAISHDRELLYHLHESDFQRLRFIQEALKALDRGQYGDCIRCQEETEKDRSSSDLVMAGLEEETDF